MGKNRIKEIAKMFGKERGEKFKAVIGNSYSYRYCKFTNDGLKIKLDDGWAVDADWLMYLILGEIVIVE